jgi:hypothetical protein
LLGDDRGAAAIDEILIALQAGGAFFPDLAERSHVAVVEAGDVGHHDDAVELGEIGAPEQDLGELIEVVDEAEPATGVTQDVRDLARGAGGINGHAHQAG